MEPRFLLTGFSPFNGEHINPSWLAAQRAAAELLKLGFSAAAVEIPCVFETAPTALADAIAEHHPSIVLCTGQASGRAGIGLERVAINLQDARIADNAGAQPIDRPVRADGPAAYFSTLPLKANLQALTERHIPAELSQTAGTYVCNSLFYSLMDQLAVGSDGAGGNRAGNYGARDHIHRAGGNGVRGGFVHIPLTPEQSGGSDVPTMPVELAASALVCIARTTADTTMDLRFTAGTLS